MTTPPQPDPASPLDVAQGLTAALNGLSDRLDAVKTDSEARDEALATQGEQTATHGRRTRLLFWADVVLTVALAALGIKVTYISGDASTARDQAVAATASAAAQHASNIAGCQSGNELRKQELALWTYLISMSKATSPAQAAALAAFDKRVGATYAARDCARIYAVPPVKLKPGAGG